MSNKFIIFRSAPDLVEGLDEVIEFMKANTEVRVTKTDALKYLITLFQGHQNFLVSSLESVKNKGPKTKRPKPNK